MSTLGRDSMKQVNHLQEIFLPQYQLLTVTAQDKDMGCRLKDLLYISVIILLGIGVWSSYSKQNDVNETGWPWSEDNNVLDMDNNFENIGRLGNGDYDHRNVDDDDGFRHPGDGEDEGGFNIDDNIISDIQLHQSELSPHLPLQEDIVHGENQEMESTEDQVELASKKESGIVAGQVGMLPQSGNINAELLATARQILLKHANNSPNNRPVGVPQNLPSGIANHEPTFQSNEKPKPRLVFRSHAKRDADQDGGAKPKIPRIIHQSWESTEIPLNFAKWVKSWLQNNPGWEYWFWTPSDVRVLVDESYPKFTDILSSGKMSLDDQANVMRYFIIHAHGGVYAELDMECLNSIDTWIFSHGCFLAEEAREHSYLVNNKLSGSVINALMACRPHHPFYEVILHALPDYLSRYTSDPQRASGSFFLDDIYRAFKKHPLPPSLVQYGDVSLIEPDYFIPSYDEKHWAAIDKACNTNIADMPFHVSWLCTLWIRKRMHENQPYKHSYTDHHWTDISELGPENVATIPITTVIQNAIAGTGQVETPNTGLLPADQVLATEEVADDAANNPQSVEELAQPEVQNPYPPKNDIQQPVNAPDSQSGNALQGSAAAQDNSFVQLPNTGSNDNIIDKVPQDSMSSSNRLVSNANNYPIPPSNGEQAQQPQVPYSDQQPQAPYSDQQPQAPYSDQQPQAPYSDQQPQAPYSDQQPQAQYGDQQPQAPYSNQQAQAAYSDQQPQVPYSGQQSQTQNTDQQLQAQYSDQQLQAQYSDQQPQLPNDIRQPQSAYSGPQQAPIYEQQQQPAYLDQHQQDPYSNQQQPLSPYNNQPAQPQQQYPQIVPQQANAQYPVNSPQQAPQMQPGQLP